VSQQTIDERKLSELTPARRNRYYYGKLMDVLHFSMEQQYVLAKEWLYNRAVLGAGVVCGLGVEPLTTAAGKGVVVRAGLAIDGWGREIVVPEDVALVPLELTDPCGTPAPAAAPPPATLSIGSHETAQPTGSALPGELRIELCYAECLTDFAPTYVSDDCGCDGGCESGTVVETYCLRVREGHGDDVELPCLDSVMEGIKSGDLHQVLCRLTATCAPDPADPCLTLANLSINADGNLEIDTCSPRPIAPSNRVLMQLIACLAKCCGEHEPPPKHLLEVTAVRVLRRGQQKPDAPGLPVLAELAPPNNTITVTLKQQPEIVEVEFDASIAYDTATAVLGKSFVVNPPSKLDKLITSAPGNVVRLWRQRGFRPGEYKFLLRGDPGPGNVLTIDATDGTHLDGEFPTSGAAGWHSGDGGEGGDFVFQLVVK
jgi:hypothetical protein